MSTTAGDFLSVAPEWLSAPFSEGMPVAYVVEAHKIEVGNEFENCVLGKVEGRVLDGSREILEVSVVNLGNIKCERANTTGVDVDDAANVGLSWRASDAYVLPQLSG